MEASPVGDRCHLGDRGAHERDRVAGSRGDEPGGVEGVDGIAEPVGRDLGDRPDQLVVEVGAGAQRSEHRPGLGRELVHLGTDRRHQRGAGRAQRRSEPAGRDGPGGDPLGQQQPDQRRHAVGLVVDDVDQLVVDRSTEDDGGQLGNFGLVQRPEGDQWLAAPEHRVEGGEVAVSRRRAVGDDEALAPVRRPLGQGDDDPQRPRVEPLGLVDHQRGAVEPAGDQVAVGPDVVTGVAAVEQVPDRAEPLVALQPPAGHADDADILAAEPIHHRVDDRAAVRRPRGDDAELGRPAVVGRAESRHARERGRGHGPASGRDRSCPPSAPRQPAGGGF